MKSANPAVAAAPVNTARLVIKRLVTARAVADGFFQFLAIIISWSRLVPGGVVFAGGLSCKFIAFSSEVDCRFASRKRVKK
jgi:hypothetical protein